MRRTLTIALVAVSGVCLSPTSGLAQTPIGTAFTYQGQLKRGTPPRPVSDETCDLRFFLWNDPVAADPANQVGPALTFDGVHPNPPPIAVKNGLFQTMLDFGSGAITGDARWLEVQVCCPTSCSPAFTPLTPRQELTPTPYALALPGLRTQQTLVSPNLIGGSTGNTVTPGVVGATIGGGGGGGGFGDNNRVTDDYGTVGGGDNNQAGDSDDTTNNARWATVGGGSNNVAQADRATVSGGIDNIANGVKSTVGGGEGNRANDLHATVAGGFGNEAGPAGFVGGGARNNVSGTRGTIGGGDLNIVEGGHGTVGGGSGNVVQDSYATVGGGYSNHTTASYATIAGGGRSNPANAITGNRVTDDYGTIGGGGYNQAGDAAGYDTDATYATVGGGYHNVAGAEYTTIGGGRNNSTTAWDATVGGGRSNSAGTIGTVGGGRDNEASGQLSTVGGGDGNIASGASATVGGGAHNTAEGNSSTVGGGLGNHATGYSSTVPGGSNTDAIGNYSFAAGRRAKANDDGAFVWADSTNADFSSTGPDQFLIRASGGVGITGSLEASGTITSGSSIIIDGSAGSEKISSTGELELHVSSGRVLRIEPDATSPNLIGGYSGNAVTAGAVGATIGGGGESGFTNRITDVFGTIGGGRGNRVGNDAGTTTDARYATVCGGFGNTATGIHASVGGGKANDATGEESTVGGGVDNNAAGISSTVPGGHLNDAVGDFSFAAGRRAKANHDGTFVWADSSLPEFASTGPDQLLIRATGGVGIGIVDPAAMLDVNGDVMVRRSLEVQALVGTFDSDCCVAHVGTGCDTASCQTAVCDVDSYCCGATWDATCRKKARQICESLCDSVDLPEDSISGRECTNEPGVASNHSFWSGSFDLPYYAYATIVSRTITAPTDGYVLAIATGEVQINSTTLANHRLMLGLSELNSTSVRTSGSAEIPSHIDGSWKHTIPVHTVYAVGPGYYEVRLMAGLWGAATGSAAVLERHLTLVFFPTAYGSVASTAAANAPIGSDRDGLDEMPLGRRGDAVVRAESHRIDPTMTSVARPERVADRSGSQAITAARLERELGALRAAMKGRLAALEQQLEQLRELGGEEE